MSIVLRIVLALMALAYITLIIINIKKNRLQFSMSVYWLFTGIIMLAMVALPDVVEYISHFFGFENASNMIFCVAIFIAFYLIFNAYILVSKEYSKNVVLIQEVGLLKDRVKKLEEKIVEKN